MFLEITFGEGVVYSLISILIVFLIILLICFIVGLFKFIKVSEPVQETVKPLVQAQKLSIDDITDDDMMAACLVASIDYRQSVKTDVRVVSVKEIK